MAKFALADGKAVETAVNAARGPAKGPNYFVVLGFAAEVPNVLKVLQEGEGSWAEASAALPANDAAFVFLRKDWKVEVASTQKFAYIEWQPDAIPAKRRVFLSGARAEVDKVVKPYHVILQASVKADVDEKIITDRIGAVSGTASFVKGAAAAAPAPAAKGPSVVAAAKAAEEKKDAKQAPAAAPHVARGVQGAAVKLADDAAFNAAIKAVRDEKNETEWAVFTYAANTLSVTAQGGNGWTGLSAAIPADSVSVSLLRVKDIIDGKSITIKFVFVKCVPANTKPMVRGELPTRMSSIEKFIGQFHVAFDIEKADDLTAEAITNKVGSASGSKSHIVNK